MRTLSVFAAIFFMVVAVYATGLHLGFEMGYAEGEKFGPLGFISGGTAYGSVAQLYALLVFCSIGCLVSSKITNIFVSSFICFLSLTAAIRPIYHIYLQKNYTQQVPELESFRRLLTESPFLNICIGMCVMILILQIVTILLHFRNKHKTVDI